MRIPVGNNALGVKLYEKKFGKMSGFYIVSNVIEKSAKSHKTDEETNWRKYGEVSYKSIKMICIYLKSQVA